MTEVFNVNIEVGNHNSSRVQFFPKKSCLRAKTFVLWRGRHAVSFGGGIREVNLKKRWHRHRQGGTPSNVEGEYLWK